MFQNVSNARVERDIEEDNKISIVLRELFTPHNTIIYILTFLVSMVSIKNEIIPFGLAILAACMGTTVPIFMVYIVSFISTGIFFGSEGLSSFFGTSLIFFILVIVFKPKVSLDDRNEVLKVGTRLFWASFIYSLIQNFSDVFLIYDVFLGFVIAALTYTFYKIFVNGIVVVRDWPEKRAFTIEELIAVAIIFSIAVSSLKDISIFSLSISNILIIFVILILGWKNGMLVGGTAGLSIGLALTLVGNITLLQLTVFAVSGILAGVFNKFGKIGVIIGFLLGNAILTYLANGNTATIIYFREIFIAAILLFFVPSGTRIKVEDLFGKEKFLPVNSDKKFKVYGDVKEKLDGITDTIDGIDEEISSAEENVEIKKEIYIDNFLENFEEYQGNIFYDDISQNENLIGDVFDEFKINDVVTENMLIEIFKKYNNYILLRDQKIKEDLQELIKIANRTYRELQIKMVKEKTRKEEKIKMKNELKNVSNIIKKISNEDLDENKFESKEKEISVLLKGKGIKINSVNLTQNKNGKYIISLNLNDNDDIREKSKINSIAETISKSFGSKFSFQKDKKNLTTGEYIQTYSNTDKFMLQVGSSKIIKSGNKVSGDSNLQVKLEDGKYLLAISDGMGNGANAKKASKFVINTLSKLLEKGFEEDDVLNLINSELNLNKNDEMYASVDMSVLDLYLGNISMIKNGASNTYIKDKMQNVKVYSSKEMPVGIIENVNWSKETIDLHDGDIILMCSDGLLDSKEDIEWVEQCFKSVGNSSAQRIADWIANEAVDNSYGSAKDDITIIVAKIISKN